MAERLASAGHDVHLLTYGQGSEQVGRGYRHHRLARLPGDDSSRSGPNLAKPVLDAMLAARLAAICREHAIEVVHAHNYEALVASLAARAIRRVPVVYHSHNLMGDELETYFEGGAARALAAATGRVLDRTLPRRADHAIALCEWSASRLRALGCRAEDLSVIPPAVEDEGPLVGSEDDRAAFGLGPRDFVVGYVGNLDAYQNLALLRAAFAKLASVPDARGRAGRPRLLVATHTAAGHRRVDWEDARGDGDLRLVEVSGHAEARRALAVSDVVALPRRLGSGYPVKLLNSMSAAKAVVTAGCGSKVLRDGVDGLVVADDDPGAFAGALERCRRLPDLRRALGGAARATFLERLTWEKVLPQVERVYAGLREPTRATGSRVP
jgi:1,2-diacylglycerol 3-alpha-glucosyltransferase